MRSMSKAMKKVPNQENQKKPPQVNKTLVKMILNHMKEIAVEDAKEEPVVTTTVATATVHDEAIMLRSLALEPPRTLAKRSTILLDGGASHHVYYSPRVPKGAEEKEVELAHGSKKGYVKGGDIIFIDESTSEEQAETPAIISLGRLIRQGIKMEWTKAGASLVLPNKKKIVLPIRNNCPYASKEVLNLVKRLRKIEEKEKVIKSYYAKLYTPS